MYSGTQLYKFEKDGKVSPSQWEHSLPKKPGQSKFLIITDKWPLSNSQQEMLSKLVDAVNLSNDEAWITHLPAENRTTLQVLKEGIPLSHVVGLGVAPEQLCVHAVCEPYQPIELNGIQITFTHAVDQLEPNKALRLSLWEALKVMFNLK